METCGQTLCWRGAVSSMYDYTDSSKRQTLGYTWTFETLKPTSSDILPLIRPCLFQQRQTSMDISCGPSIQIYEPTGAISIQTPEHVKPKFHFQGTKSKCKTFPVLGGLKINVLSFQGCYSLVIRSYDFTCLLKQNVWTQCVVTTEHG